MGTDTMIEGLSCLVEKTAGKNTPMGFLHVLAIIH